MTDIDETATPAERVAQAAARGDRNAWLWGFRREDRVAAWDDFVFYGEAIRDDTGARVDVVEGRRRARLHVLGDESPLPACIRGPRP